MRVCGACSKEYPDTMRFCADCGKKLAEISEASPAQAPGVNVQDAVVVGGVHITSTDSRTFISRQDDTREVLTCAGCGAHVRKPNGFTCPHCNRFFCTDDYDKEQKSCRLCLESKSSAAIHAYQATLDEVMQDGRIDPGERAQLERARVRLGLDADECERLEKARRASGGTDAGRLGRRDQALLEDGRQLLFTALAFDDALKVVTPLFERFPEHPEVRKVYLLALLEANPDRAAEVLKGMRFDDLDKSLAQIELLSRRGAFDRAYEILEDGRRAFGADHPDLIACEGDLSLEEYRRTGRRALLEVAAECLGRLPSQNTEYASFAQAFLLYIKGDKPPLAELEQAGNYYAKRKKRYILSQADARIKEAARQQRPAPPPKDEGGATAPPPPPTPPPEKEIRTAQPPIPPAPPPPIVPPVPQPPLLMPGMWQLTIVSSWGQSFYGTCQVTTGGPNVMLVVDVSGQALLWDGLVHFFQERSIFRGTLSGINLFAICGELVRMVDGMVVPVPGLPARLNAVVGDNGRSISGTVVNSLGETARVVIRI
jgi:hypothetical protein